MLKRPHYIALGLMVLLTLILLNLPGRTTAQLKQGIGSLFLPLVGLAGASQQVLGQAGDSLLSRRELLKQMENLRRENMELRLQAMQAEETRRENNRLRQLVGWEQRQNWKLKLAKVVLREPANWWHTVRIDVGSRDGIKINMPVLTTDGLVGRIATVNLNHSQVVLPGDPNCKVAARVDNEGRDSGVIGASGPLDSGFVEMGYLAASANLKPGQNVRTSGEGGIFPPDIPIGKVVDTQIVEYGLSTVARVKLAANLSALDEVFVILQ